MNHETRDYSPLIRKNKAITKIITAEREIERVEVPDLAGQDYEAAAFTSVAASASGFLFKTIKGVMVSDYTDI